VANTARPCSLGILFSDAMALNHTDISLNMLGKKDRFHFHSILLHAVKFSKWLRCLPPAEMTTSCMATVVMFEEVENLPF
jgi:hypothetical protein